MSLLRLWHQNGLSVQRSLLFPVLFLSVFTLCYLLFSIAVFATDEEALLTDLLNAIVQDDAGAVEAALMKGADPKKVNFFPILPRLEIAELLLHNEKKPLDPNKFLKLILNFRSKNTHEKPVMEVANKLAEQKYTLVNLALKEGADPNKDHIFKKLIYGIIINPDIAELLFNNEYKKIDPDLFCQFIRRKLMYLDITGYSSIPHDPAVVLYMRYRNLNAKAALFPKIPRIIHHIWVTNERIRKEIPEVAIQFVLNTDKVFSQGKQKWEHIVWTNDKNLIPVSVEKLESNGVKVKELSEIKNKFKLNEKIDNLIEQELWGMASDTLRIELVRCLGGVYSDLNFVFTRSLESDIHKYDFFTELLGFDAMFAAFGSTAYHPILEEAIFLIGKKLDNKLKIISLMGPEDRNSSKKITPTITNLSLTAPYYKRANKNGTIDVLYPSNGVNYRGQTFETAVLDIVEKYVNCSCNQEIKEFERMVSFNKFILNNEICGPKDISIGHDTVSLSWLKPEERDD